MHFAAARSLLYALFCLFATMPIGGHLAEADFVSYRLPGTKLIATFEGKTKVLGGRLLEYTHPTFGTIILNLDDTTIVKAPTRQEEFKRLLNKASKSKDIEDYLEAARQAMKRGLLK